MLSLNPATFNENIFGSNLWFTIVTLVWGYICVGIGFGIYKILQGQGFIKDEVNIASVPLNEPV